MATGLPGTPRVTLEAEKRQLLGIKFPEPPYIRRAREAEGNGS
jgi:hypothetical protein